MAAGCPFRSPRVVSLALSLIETLVKNCGFPLHQEVATEKFMAQMARIARSYSEKTGRDNLEVADMVMEYSTIREATRF